MDDTSLALWLRQREQADWNARSAVLTGSIVAALPADRPVRVLDLATGAGSNVRYLIDRLPQAQQWLVLDRSLELLAALGSKTRTWARERGLTLEADAAGFTLTGAGLDCRVDTVAQDLGSLEDASSFAGRHLVTASALLDLVSESWLRQLASRCRAAGASVLLTITYDGRSTCDPAEPEDEYVRGLMNVHQGRDKGLGGPAEGPRAAACAERCLAAEGYRVVSETSDWRLGPGDTAMQRTLIDGWAQAASEVEPGRAAAIASWRARRLAHVDAGRSRLVVGHRDLAATLR